MNGKLEKDLIAQPELWRMALIISPKALEVALYPPVESEEAIFRSFALDCDADSQLKTVEDVIYENPLLLSDFKSVQGFIDNDSFLLLPDEIEPDRHEALLKAAAQDPSRSWRAVSSPASPGVNVVMAADEELCRFLSRTFFNISIAHVLAPLCRFLSGHSSGRRSYGVMGQRRMHMISFDNLRLLSANTFSYTEPMDAVYYILASRSISGLDHMEHPHYYAGLPQGVDSTVPILRSYLGQILPPELQPLPYRATRASLDAHYLLTILPLCESYEENTAGAGLMCRATYPPVPPPISPARTYSTSSRIS